MSERYTVDREWFGKTPAIRDEQGKLVFGVDVACRRLNRLAAQVATLRELLIEAKPIAAEVGYYDLERRIDAALADTEPPG